MCMNLDMERNQPHMSRCHPDMGSPGGAFGQTWSTVIIIRKPVQIYGVQLNLKQVYEDRKWTGSV